MKTVSLTNLGWAVDARFARQLLYAATLAISLTGCGSNKPPPTEEDVRQALQEFAGGFGITVTSVTDLKCEPLAEKPGMACSFATVQSAHNYSTGQNTESRLTPKDARFVKSDDKWVFCPNNSPIAACQAKT